MKKNYLFIKMFNAAKKFWRGEETLGRAFWLWGIMANLTPLILLILLNLFNNELLDYATMSKNYFEAFLRILFFTLPLFSSLYLPFSFVGFFRSVARSVSWWKYPAIITSLLLALNGVGLLFMWWMVVLRRAL